MTLEQWSRNPHDVSLQFLQQLNSSKGYVREASVRELKSAPPKVLMRLLYEEAIQQEQAYSRALPYWLGSIACVGIMIYTTVTHLSEWIRQEGSAFLVVVFYVGMAIGVKGMWTRAAHLRSAHSEQAREHLCVAVRANQDPALIGLIVDWLKLPGEQGHRFLMDAEPWLSFCIALENLLSLVNSADRQAIAQNCEQTWRYLLRESQVSAGLKIQLLALMEKWGTAQCISAVNGLLHANPELELTFAAQRCLFALQQREAEAKQSATLLRASNANFTPPETLLRPATYAEDAKPEQLLRPS